VRYYELPISVVPKMTLTISTPFTHHPPEAGGSLFESVSPAPLPYGRCSVNACEHEPAKQGRVRQQRLFEVQPIKAKGSGNRAS
jgi:hypothetical protein